MKLNDLRAEYRFAKLLEENIKTNPFDQFKKWLNEALEAKVNEPTAMSVATVGRNGFPDSRIVLLKDFNQDGFTFFTNYQSNKGSAIEIVPAVGLLFFWPELERQVRISGLAEKTDPEISDAYFNSRPENSRIAAIASQQSAPVESRDVLEKRFLELKSTLNNKLIRPENWGGYLVRPVRVEFWQGRESRLHDRILYEKLESGWTISRLAP